MNDMPRFRYHRPHTPTRARTCCRLSKKKDTHPPRAHLRHSPRRICDPATASRWSSKADLRSAKARSTTALKIHIRHGGSSTHHGASSTLHGASSTPLTRSPPLKEGIFFATAHLRFSKAGAGASASVIWKTSGDAYPTLKRQAGTLILL